MISTVNDQAPTELRHVEAYAGASYPERPTAIRWRDRRLVVEQVLRMWRTPDGLHFLVDIEELGRAQLVYNHQQAWLLQTSR